ncbi:MAG: hypothetical protein U1F25_12585 [Rubrivivax sp.]
MPQALYREALLADPNEPLAHLLLGTTHTFKGEGQQAMRMTEARCACRPWIPMRFYFDSHAAGAALSAGELPRAIELAERLQRSNRLYHTALRTLAIAQSLAGRAKQRTRPCAASWSPSRPDGEAFRRHFAGRQLRHRRCVSPPRSCAPDCPKVMANRDPGSLFAPTTEQGEADGTQ